jgi:MFS family permease
MGMWSVNFGNVLRAHGYETLIGYAYACSGVAAFISPLAMGALADQSIAPTRLVRWLSVFTAGSLALTFFAIESHWAGWAVLLCVQIQAICGAPIFGLSTTIILATLDDPERQFGPLRAAATFGWMASGWVISFVLMADASTRAGFAAAGLWIASAAFTWMLPETPPIERKETRGWRDILGLGALDLLRNRDHRVVFLSAALFTIPLAPFYPYTPIQLTELGVPRATAAMTLGQVSELVCMFGLAGILARLRLKWVFLAGIGIGAVRLALCGLHTAPTVLASIFLHGFAYTLFFITAQIYLEQRIDPRMRARSQALLAVMTGGFGNLFGYLGAGWWRSACTTAGSTDWPRFWLGAALAATAVFLWFAITYQGRKAIGK